MIFVLFCFILSDLRIPVSRNKGRERGGGGEEIGERGTRERGKKREGKRKKGKKRKKEEKEEGEEKQERQQ